MMSVGVNTNWRATEKERIFTVAEGFSGAEWAPVLVIAFVRDFDDEEETCLGQLKWLLVEVAFKLLVGDQPWK